MRHSRNSEGDFFKMVVFLTVGLMALYLFAQPTDEKTATSVLQSDGFTDVQITGYAWFACDEKDIYSTGFTALKNGKFVKGVVCAGWLKGSTIRFTN